MAARFGIVKTIILIATLMITINMIALIHFQSKYSPQEDGRHRRKVIEDDDYMKFEQPALEREVKPT